MTCDELFEPPVQYKMCRYHTFSCYYQLGSTSRAEQKLSSLQLNPISVENPIYFSFVAQCSVVTLTYSLLLSIYNQAVNYSINPCYQLRVKTSFKFTHWRAAASQCNQAESSRPCHSGQCFALLFFSVLPWLAQAGFILHTQGITSQWCCQGY